ncbi:tRNA (guanine-N(7)-)-methyltransferase-like [Eucalyptus grandis]|uniref:tRNA (guanine-N(7)-)-methyltransferase-like n=1 Tax=Eucalyptus grandis TaxID=71139 RepID=UPI00192E97BC|nr:tRNA (guanine-N(7)-)-methyltransferase-like [Eucalyptus grandis]
MVIKLLGFTLKEWLHGPGNQRMGEMAKPSVRGVVEPGFGDSPSNIFLDGATNVGMVISPHLLGEYAYTLAIGGINYTITNVEELGKWMKDCLENHPMFEALTDEELVNDPVVKLLTSVTEEGQNVARNGGQTFQAICRCIAPSL